MAENKKMHGERRNGSPPDPTRSKYSAAFPDLDRDEYAELVASIRRDGLRDAIWTYRSEVLDGWHRLLACREAGVEPRFREYTGDDPAHFALSAQRARRNWSSSQAAAVAAALEPDLAKEAQERKRQSGKVHGRGQQVHQLVGEPIATPQPAPEETRCLLEDPAAQEPPDELEATGSTEVREEASAKPRSRDSGREKSGLAATQAASAVGTNRQYVTEYKRIESADKALAEKVRSGEVAIPRASRILRDRDAAEKRRAELLANEQASLQTPELHFADFREVELSPESVDAVITDPQYDRKYLDLYGDLAEMAARVLKPGGVLLALSGQAHLPEVLRLLGEHLSYHWVLDYRVPGANTSIQGKKALNGWKPVLLYSKGSYAGDAFIDYLSSPAPEKNLHERGQSEAAFAELVQRFTKTDDLILDPFMGSGTTGAAAIAAKRRFIGCEIDPGEFEKARKRLGVDAEAPSAADPEGSGHE